MTTAHSLACIDELLSIFNAAAEIKKSSFQHDTSEISESISFDNEKKSKSATESINIMHYFDNASEYTLSDSRGFIWDECYVYHFVKCRPHKTYEIAKGYSDLLRTYGNYQKYEPFFGYGSFYEEIITLSNNDGGIVIHLCQESMNDIMPLIVNGYIPVHTKHVIPLEIIKMITKYLIMIELVHLNKNDDEQKYVKICHLNMEVEPEIIIGISNKTMIEYDSFFGFENDRATWQNEIGRDEYSDEYAYDSDYWRTKQSLAGIPYKSYTRDGKYDDYTLSSDQGIGMWNECFVHLFIKNNPNKAYEIGQKHSRWLNRYNKYEEYQGELGFGSFYEDIITLANADGELVCHLSKTAYDNMVPIAVDGYIPLKMKSIIPSDIIGMILGNFAINHIDFDIGELEKNLSGDPYDVAIYPQRPVTITQQNNYNHHMYYNYLSHQPFHSNNFDDYKYPYPDIDQFLLTSDVGKKLWSKCRVYSFIKFCPEKVWNIAGGIGRCWEYSVEDVVINYKEYEIEYGFGSFYEDVYRLAYEDGDLVVDLCQNALKYTNDVILSGFIPKYIPFDIIDVISSHFDDESRLDIYLASKYVNHEYRYGDYSECIGLDNYFVEGLSLGVADIQLEYTDHQMHSFPIHQYQNQCDLLQNCQVSFR